jgi:hypothetical protein
MCGCGSTRNPRSTEPKKKALIVVLGSNPFFCDVEFERIGPGQLGTQHIAPYNWPHYALSKRPFEASFRDIDKEQVNRWLVRVNEPNLAARPVASPTQAAYSRPTQFQHQFSCNF